MKLTSRGNFIENEFYFSLNTIWCAIENFSYSSEYDVTFESNFRSYEDLYKINWNDSKKIRLLSKLSRTDHAKFVNYILPRKCCELTFTEAVELPMELFTLKTPLFYKRWKCRNLTKKEEDFTTFVSVVNKHCNNFRLAELSADNFKCLIFVQGLLSIIDAEIRRRILNKLEDEPNITLSQITEDCQRYCSVKQDSKKI